MTNALAENGDKKILFFDGVCNLCNSSVDFFVWHQQSPKIYVAPLQGETAQKILLKEDVSELKSLVYFRNGQVYRESSAVLFAVVDLGGLWSLARGLLIIPEFFRNLIYRFIARHRYQWFGKKDTCRLPSEKEKKFFLP